MVEAGTRARYVLLEGALGGIGITLGHLPVPDGQGQRAGESPPVVLVDCNQTVSQGLAQGLEAVLAQGDEPATWEDVQYVVVSRGPGSYTGVRALLAFSYGMHGASLWQERPPKRYWIGVSSLAMIMISSFHGGTPAVVKAERRGVFMVQGHRKGYFGWCEPIGAGPDPRGWLSPCHQGAAADIDQFEYGGWRYYTVSAAVVAGADELAEIVGDAPSMVRDAPQELWWIPQQAVQGKQAAQGDDGLPARPVSANTYVVIQTRQMPAPVLIPLQDVAVQSWATAAAVRSSLKGMRQLLTCPEAVHQPRSYSWLDGVADAVPPAAAYLRPHYGITNLRR